MEKYTFTDVVYELAEKFLGCRAVWRFLGRWRWGLAWLVRDGSLEIWKGVGGWGLWDWGT